MNGRLPESNKKAASAAQIPLNQVKQPPGLNKRNILTIICLFDQDVLNRNAQQPAQRKEVVHCGQVLPAQPFVNGPGQIKAKVNLQRTNGDLPLLQQMAGSRQ